MRRISFFLAVLLGVSGPAPAQAPRQYVLADSTGKTWSSPDPAWLQKYVAQRNAELAGAPAVPAVNYGLALDRIPKVQAGTHKTWGNVDHSFGADATGDGGPARPDVFLTVIGEGAKSVVDGWQRDPEFHAVAESMGGRLGLKSMPAKYPTIDGLKFEAGGKPDILLETAGGKEVFRAYADPGPAVVAGEIRKADPLYKPGGLPLVEAPEAWVYHALLALAVFGLVYLVMSRSANP